MSKYIYLEKHARDCSYNFAPGAYHALTMRLPAGLGKRRRSEGQPDVGQAPEAHPQDRGEYCPRIPSPWVALTVETARRRATVLQGLLAAGEDPEEAKQGSRKELTVAQLCDLYLAEGLATPSTRPLRHRKSHQAAHRDQAGEPGDPPGRGPTAGGRRGGQDRRTSKTGKKRGLSRMMCVSTI